jgi:hypothetical protein
VLRNGNAYFVECLGRLDAFLSDVGSSTKLSAEVKEDVDVVVAAENLRAAANCLAKITGKGEAGDVEEVLGWCSRSKFTPAQRVVWVTARAGSVSGNDLD